jgi:hypothetical protein
MSGGLDDETADQLIAQTSLVFFLYSAYSISRSNSQNVASVA